MRVMRTIFLGVCGLIVLGAGEGAAPYTNDFEKAETLPAEFLIVQGQFAVAKEGTNKYLELSGEPLDSFGFLAGPEGATAVGARIRASSTGKRMPEFGVGLGGAGGYRLWVMPAAGEIQILKGDEVVAAKQYEWRSGIWTQLRFEMIKGEGEKFVLRGKAWEDGKAQPAMWMITANVEAKPVNGRASYWGTPYSGTPIGFDDVYAGEAK